jgi:hypothetical protein
MCVSSCRNFASAEIYVDARIGVNSLLGPGGWRFLEVESDLVTALTTQTPMTIRSDLWSSNDHVVSIDTSNQIQQSDTGSCVSGA